MPARDRRTANPIVNLLMWLIAMAIMVTVAVAAGGPLVQVVGNLLSAPTPLAGRVAMALGLGVMALSLLLFFVWLVTTLIRSAVAHRAGRHER